MPHYIGLDLGGTNIKAGLLDHQKQALAQTSVPTDGEDGPDAVMQRMADAAQAVADEAGVAIEDVAAIGIGAPGPMDIEMGVIKSAPNLPGWENIPVRDRIRQLTGRPTVLENDANAAAFGEFWAGAGRNQAIRHMVMLTLGTGIGFGIISRGKVVHGATGIAGEGGHLILVPNGRQCGCGQRGCLETYASANSTAARAIEAIKAGESSILREKAGDDLNSITSRKVFEAAKAGDGLAERIVNETAEYLGIAAVTICRLLDPQMIVFAGGMILAGDYLFDKVRSAFSAQTWDVAEDHVRLEPALLGNDAGFIGAAAVAWDAHQRGRL